MEWLEKQLAGEAELAKLLESSADDANAALDKLEEEEVAAAMKFARASLGLKAAMGVIKQAGTTEEMKKSLAESLKGVKQAVLASPKAAVVDEPTPAASALLGELEQRLGGAAAVAGAPGQVWDAQVTGLLVAAKQIARVREDVRAARKAVDGTQAELIERSLKCVVTLVKEAGTPEQKKALAEAFKALPREIPEDSAAADRIMAWRNTVRKAAACARPQTEPLREGVLAKTGPQTVKVTQRRSSNPRPLRESFSASPSSSPAVARKPSSAPIQEVAPKAEPRAVEQSEGEAGMVEDVQFAEEFDAGTTSTQAPKTIHSSAETMCPKCKGDFFSVAELQSHIRAGCSGGTPAPLLLRVQSEENLDKSSPALPKKAGFLQNVRETARRASGGGAGGGARDSDGTRELVIGAPTNISHSATADASGRITILTEGNKSPRSSGTPGTPAARRLPPPAPTSAQTSATAPGAAPSTPGLSRMAGPASAGTPGPSTPQLRRPSEDETSSGGDKRASMNLTKVAAAENVIEFSKIRVQLSDALVSRIKASGAKVRLVFTVGNEKRSTDVVQADVPGFVDFSSGRNLCIPSDMQGKPFSIFLHCKPVAESARTSSSSRIDQLTNKANLLGVSESLAGGTKEIQVGMVPKGAFTQVFYGCKAVAGSPLESVEVGVVTCTASHVTRAPVAEMALQIIAPRKMPDQHEEIKTVESCKLLQKKIEDVRVFVTPGAPAPSRMKRASTAATGDKVRDAMEAWPPNVKVVAYAVRAGFRPPDNNFKNWAGQNLLHMAVMSGDVDVIGVVLRFGLEADADEHGGFDKDGTVNVRKQASKKTFFRCSDKDDSGVSPFFMAVMLGNNQVISALVDFDQDVMNQTFYSLSALHVACCAGLLDMVKFLVDTLRVPVDIKDQNSATPIFYASFGGNQEVVEFLCSRGAFVDLEDGQSQSPIMMALEAGNAQIARVLLNYKADVNSFNLRGDNAIWLCIVRNIPDLLAEFVASGRSDLGAGLERHRNTLLHKLILFIDNEQMGCMMVASLLSHGAKVEALNDEKKTPLFHACALSKFKIVTLLLNSGANPKAVDCFENTPLHFAFSPNICAALVDKGAKVNASNAHGMTPMHIMSAFGLLETVSALRAMGAKDSERNKNGNTSADVFNLIPPRDWRVCLPFFADDEASVATGGIVINDKPRSENGAQVANVKTKARNSFRNVGRKLKEAGKKIRDELEAGSAAYSNNNNNNNNGDDDDE